MKLHDIHIGPGLTRLWLALAAASAGSLADVADFTVRSAPSSGWAATAVAIAGLVCLAVFKATALTALYALCRRNVWLKTAAALLIAAFMVLSLLNGFSWLFYGFGISMKLFRIIMETNPTEVGEFMPELTDKLASMARSPWCWICIAAFAALWKWLPKVAAGWQAAASVTLSALGLGYLAYVFATAEFGRTSHSVFARSGRCVMKYIHDSRMIRDLQAKKRPLYFPESLNSSKAAERIVVAIGESASRDHLSLYGYPLETTPRLDSIRNDLYIFTGAVASSTSTAENMPRLLTFMTDEPSAKEWYEYPSLLQIFSQLGYRTYWLSNQEYSGQWSNLSSILSSDADVIRYVGSMDSEDQYLFRYDDALMPEWNNALTANDSLQLTFLHLMGSHFQYDRRIPPDRRRFTAADVKERLPRRWLDDRKAGVAANYDNSILYTDSILSCVIDGIRQMPEPALLIYLSDHGENVYDDRDYRGRDPKYVRVPFLIYANEAYRHQNPGTIREIEDAAAKPFSTSELPQMLMHLAGIRYALYDSVRDPLSAAFRVRKRWVDGEAF